MIVSLIYIDGKVTFRHLLGWIFQSTKFVWPDVCRIRNITFSEENNISLKLDIFRSYNHQHKKNLPVFFFIHGGAWVFNIT